MLVYQATMTILQLNFVPYVSTPVKNAIPPILNVQNVLTDNLETTPIHVPVNKGTMMMDRLIVNNVSIPANIVN